MIKNNKKSIVEKLMHFFYKSPQLSIRKENIAADNGVLYTVKYLNEKDSEVSLMFDQKTIFKYVSNDSIDINHVETMKEHPIFKMSKNELSLLELELKNNSIMGIFIDRFSQSYKILTNNEAVVTLSLYHKDNKTFISSNSKDVIDVGLIKLVKMASSYSENHYAYTLNKDLFIMCIDIFKTESENSKHISALSIYSEYDSINNLSTFCIREPSGDCHYMMNKMNIDNHKQYLSDIVFNWIIKSDHKEVISFFDNYNIDKNLSYKELRYILEMISV